MKNTYWFLVFGLFILLSCNPEKNMRITITNRMNLDNIPSASGLEKLSNKFWIIGDNSPWLFELNSGFNLLVKHAISPLDTIEGGIIPKKHKSDFEAMTSLIWEGDSALFIFGSGSGIKHRNIGKLVRMTKDGLTIINFNLSDFYELLRDEARLKESNFNIEAAAVLNNKLYLFNRGKNKLIILKLDEFKKYLEGEPIKLKIKSYSIDLPEMDGIVAGFSGACADPENNRLIFSASVENTGNWIDDGQVLGSFVGIIDVDQLHHHYYPKSIALETNETSIPIKVESLSILHAEKNKLDCYLVTDSDGGISELLTVELLIKKIRK